MKIVQRIFATGSALFLAAVFLPGCLVLADHPKVGAGEHCAVDKNCPAGTVCKVAPDGSDKLCLPPVPECTAEVDAACAGFKCNVGLQLCIRDCTTSYDCVSGYDCNYDYNTGTGVCFRATTP